MYKQFMMQLHMYAKAIHIIAKGYLPIFFVTPLKLKEILNVVKAMIGKNESRL